MPLRDHFRPPISEQSSWEGFHGMWPAVIVQQLAEVLPDHYTAEPRVHLGSFYEVDVCAFEEGERSGSDQSPAGRAAREITPEGVAAVFAPPRPTLVLDADLDDQYEYEVLILDQTRNRQLVAAVEIVSPANKDRPANRRAFVAKCAAMLQKQVCVSLVDVVTTRGFNLYCDLLDLIGHADPSFDPSPPTYAATCRNHKLDRQSRLEAWAYPLVVGQKLPTLPIWLNDDLAVALDLEATYEQTCRALRIARI